jgi:hypothetical protein
MAVAFGIANALPMMAGSLRALAKAKAGTGTEKAEDTRVGLSVGSSDVSVVYTDGEVNGHPHVVAWLLLGRSRLLLGIDRRRHRTDSARLRRRACPHTRTRRLPSNVADGAGREGVSPMPNIRCSSRLDQ